MSGTITKIDAGFVYYGDGSRYDISEAAIYTEDEPGIYIRKTVNDVGGDEYTLRAYYDRALSEGGKIRILVATIKY